MEIGRGGGGGGEAHRAHVIVLPYHGQGHINPMVQFAKRLASNGIKITVATTSSSVTSISQGLTATYSANSMGFHSIYDDIAGSGVAGPGGFKGFLDRFKDSGMKSISQLILDHKNTDCPVKCLVYDANVTWAAEIAIQLGVSPAAFFTQSCAAIASYYLMHSEVSGKPVPSTLPSSLKAEITNLGVPDLPSLGPSEKGSYPPIIRFILNQFDNLHNADWVFFNSFYKLEEEIMDWLSELWSSRVRAIGPTVPSMYIDRRLEDDKSYCFDMHKPEAATTLNWLHAQKPNSVVYVSFGSAASLSVEQIMEVANALKRINNGFLWVVKQAEQSKLPNEFIKETSDKGLVVSWCPQLEVLTHPSIGCFVSHCGWNSTMESISFGVPVVGMPQFLDQITNANFVDRVWESGIVSKADEKGITRSDEICRCIEEVMEEDGEKRIRIKAVRLKVLAMEAISEGGSSDRCIMEFVSQLVVVA